MESENQHPNVQPSRRNPFRGGNKLAFPPLDIALSKQIKKQDEEGGMPAVEVVSNETESFDSPKHVDLTIGMQSLIHPDSFSEDVENVGSSDSSDAEPSPFKWEHGVHSPERHALDRPPVLLADSQEKNLPRGVERNAFLSRHLISNSDAASPVIVP